MIRLLTILTLILTTTVFCVGQDHIGPDKLSKKDKKTFHEAKEMLKSGQDVKAAEKLSKLAEKYPNLRVAHRDLARYYLKEKDYENALIHLKKLDDLSDRPEIPVRLSMSDCYEALSRFAEAIQSVEPLLAIENLDPKRQKYIQRRSAELKFRQEAYDNPTDFEPIKLSGAINTDGLEYLPALNAESNMLVFTRRTKRSEKTWSDEDLYLANLGDDNSFSEVRPLEELNTPLDEGAFCYSPDGRILIFASRDRKDGYGGFDLYISFLKNGKWSKPRNMGSKINTRYWESQPTVANNNRTIYFSSSRPGGYGKKDIWKIEIQEDNTWGEVVNLGPNINTEEDEASPFLHPDNQTLYFRSKGHIGLGDFDIFMSKNINGMWSEATNLGYPINSKGSEGALFVDLKGELAYYSSDADQLEQHLDIYKFKLPESIRPQAVSFVKIKVMDFDTKAPIEASAIITPLGNNSRHTIKYADEKGYMISTLQKGNYNLTIEKEGYIFYSEHIGVDSIRGSDNAALIEVLLQKIPTEAEQANSSEPIILNNIFFASGSSELLETSNIELDRLHAFLVQSANLKIKIIGHTDDVGDESTNQILSEHRAKAVYDVLVSKGIDANRLSYLGLGESTPIATNDTEEGRRSNRRTEFVVLPN
ncbi:MAG: OmpA family protein [Saprospiraceae bacterium]|nr:OmpA family protein [Saprospiraceae bacterium]